MSYNYMYRVLPIDPIVLNTKQKKNINSNSIIKKEKRTNISFQEVLNKYKD